VAWVEVDPELLRHDDLRRFPSTLWTFVAAWALFDDATQEWHEARWQAIAGLTGLSRSTIYRDLALLRSVIPNVDKPVNIARRSSARTDHRRDDGANSATRTVTRELTTTEVVSSADTDTTTLSVERLCLYLAERVGQFRGSVAKAPPITARWRTDMRLLLERGPLHQSKPTPMREEHVASTIAVIFGRLAEPEGRRGFSWAAQIRSPHALRDHWHQMAVAWRQKQTTGGRGALLTGDERAALGIPHPAPLPRLGRARR